MYLTRIVTNHRVYYAHEPESIVRQHAQDNEPILVWDGEDDGAECEGFLNAAHVVIFGGPSG